MGFRGMQPSLHARNSSGAGCWIQRLLEQCQSLAISRKRVRAGRWWDCCGGWCRSLWLGKWAEWAEWLKGVLCTPAHFETFMWSANLCSNGRLVWGNPQCSNGILSQYRNARRRVLTGCDAAESPCGCIPRYTIRPG